MSGDLTRVAEDEDRRLLMLASDGCLRLMLDVERLSTRQGDEGQTREGLHYRELKREIHTVEGSYG